MSFTFPGRHSVRLSYNGHLVGILNLQDDALANAMLDRKALKTAGLVDDLNEIENVRFALRHQALDEPYYESRPKAVRIRALTGAYTKDTIALEAAVLTFEPMLVCSVCRAAVGSCEHTATWGPLLRENVWADLSNQFDPDMPVRVVIGDKAYDTTLGQVKVSPATYDPDEKVVIQDGGVTFEMTRRDWRPGRSRVS